MGPQTASIDGVGQLPTQMPFTKSEEGTAPPVAPFPDTLPPMGLAAGGGSFAWNGQYSPHNSALMDEVSEQSPPGADAVPPASGLTREELPPSRFAPSSSPPKCKEVSDVAPPAAPRWGWITATRVASDGEGTRHSSNASHGPLAAYHSSGSSTPQSQSDTSPASPPMPPAAHGEWPLDLATGTAVACSGERRAEGEGSSSWRSSSTSLATADALPLSLPSGPPISDAHMHSWQDPGANTSSEDGWASASSHSCAASHILSPAMRSQSPPDTQSWAQAHSSPSVSSNEGCDGIWLPSSSLAHASLPEDIIHSLESNKDEFGSPVAPPSGHHISNFSEGDEQRQDTDLPDLDCPGSSKSSTDDSVPLAHPRPIVEELSSEGTEQEQLVWRPPTTAPNPESLRSNLVGRVHCPDESVSSMPLPQRLGICVSSSSERPPHLLLPQSRLAVFPLPKPPSPLASDEDAVGNSFNVTDTTRPSMQNASFHDRNTHMLEGNAHSLPVSNTGLTADCDQCKVHGLWGWLQRLSLQEYYVAAARWCVEMGAVTLEEIAENIEEFSEATELKPIERQRVRKWAVKELSQPDWSSDFRGEIASVGERAKDMSNDDNLLASQGHVEETKNTTVYEAHQTRLAVDSSGNTGIELSWDPVWGILVQQVKPLPGQPGLREGDYIVAVDGCSLRNRSHEECNSIFAARIKNSVVLNVVSPVRVRPPPPPPPPNFSSGGCTVTNTQSARQGAWPSSAAQRSKGSKGARRGGYDANKMWTRFRPNRPIW